MPGHFWFEIRGTEVYKKYIEFPEKCKKNGQLDHRFSTGTDWKHPVIMTKEDYDRYKDPKDHYDGPPIYIDRETEKLQRVDELICEFLGDPKPDINRDSPGYHMCHELGFWSLYRMGGGYIEEYHVKDMIEKQIKHLTEMKWNEPKIARYIALINWVFLQKWVYQATG